MKFIESSIQILINVDLNNLIEELRCLLMHKTQTDDYEQIYLRDSNRNIRNNAKIPLHAESWCKLADDIINKMNRLGNEAKESNSKMNQIYQQISNEISKEWINTHKTSIDQNERDQTEYGRISNKKLNIKKEINELDDAINDANQKKDEIDKLNQYNLAQLGVKLSEIDPQHNEKRKM
jgi:hypothetical protein